MNITSKFNVGDTAYTINKETLRIREFGVESVHVYVTEKSRRVSYKAKGDSAYTDAYDENVCFATRDELLAHVTK